VDQFEHLPLGDGIRRQLEVVGKVEPLRLVLAQLRHEQRHLIAADLARQRRELRLDTAMRSMSARARRELSTAALSSVATGATTSAERTIAVTKSDRATDGKTPSTLSPSRIHCPRCRARTIGLSAK